MKKLLAALVLSLACFGLFGMAEAGTPVNPVTATATWTDNSTDELGFKLERQLGPCSLLPEVFVEIASVGTGVNTYVDTVSKGVRYCYRVRAFNNQYTDGTGLLQYSAYSNKADFAAPLGTPVAPGLLIMTPGP